MIILSPFSPLTFWTPSRCSTMITKKAARILKQNVSLICVNSSTKDGVMGETQSSLTEKEEILEVNELKQPVSHPVVALLP